MSKIKNKPLSGLFFLYARSNIHSIKKIKKIFKKSLTFTRLYAIMVSDQRGKEPQWGMPLLQAGMRRRWELKKDASHRRGDRNPLYFFVKKLNRTNVRSPLRSKAPQVRVCAGYTKIINISRLFCAIRKIPKKIKKM
jgi:hypothetical protein